MMQFANVFPDEKIVVSLIRQLRWGYLEKYEMVEGENQPIGLILCSGKNADNIELLQLHKSNIKVADYFKTLPSKKI